MCSPQEPAASLVQGLSSGGWVSVDWNLGKVTALLGDRQVIGSLQLV